MNLGLHGLLLQVIVTIVQFQHGFRLCSAGEPGYLDFDNLPETNFSCQGKVIGGYYADVEAGCQMFHVCTIGQKDEIMDIKFLCLNGTVFDQETRVCERVDEVDCSKSEKFYNLNLELYGNHAVTLSLHETGTDEEDDPSDLIEEHESQRTTSARPSTTSSTTTTTPRPSISSTTSASGPYQHPSGYPQHYQPQPRFPSVQTSQSKSLYDDKNGGYHHQYIYHTGDHRTNNLDNNNNGNNNNNENTNNNNNQATSYQLFSNQGVSSTTGVPQIHQIRYSSTPSTQIQIRNDHQPTVSPIFHATSSTIQTLLNSNANSPALINPIFHNHGIASTTEQFTVHNNNPRETNEYRDNDEGDDRDDNHEDRRPLEAIQPTTQGKISKLTISPIPAQEESNRSNQQGKNGQQQQRITNGFLPSGSSEDDQAVRSFYPTPRTSTKSSSSHVTHIHLPPPPAIPQLKPHQITINLQSPDIQRIVQNPSPLLPSQSRVIVTAKASVSDESGRSLNTTQLVTLPLPTIPASYDDYKEGDESFDPFYRDVPKIRNDRRAGGRFRWPIRNSRDKRSLRKKRDARNGDNIEGIRVIETSELPEEKRLEEAAMENIEVKKLETENVKKDEELFSENKKPEEMVNIEDKKSEILDEKQNDRNESKIMTSRNETVQKVDKNSGSEDNGSNVENEEHKDTDDLKTMSSRHHLDSDERIDKKSSSNTKESDEDEYIDDVKRKSTIDSRETDAEEYVNGSDEEFDSKIFDEPESQTSKDVDTRAVGQQDSKFSHDEAERYDDVEKKSKNDHSNGLGVTKRGPEEESARFSLLPEVVSSRKSHRNHSAKRIRERVSPEEDEEDEEEVYKPRKSHRKHSARKSKQRERVLPEEEEEEEENDEEEIYREEVFKPRKSHRKHSARKSKPKERILPHEDEEEEQEDEEQDREEIYRPRKIRRKNAAKKSKLRERLPAVEEEDEENEEEEELGSSVENFRPRTIHRKHSGKKSKLRERLPPVEEEEEERSEEIPKHRTSRRKNSAKKSKLRQLITLEETEEEEEIERTRESPENYDYYDTEIDSSSVRSNEEYSTEYSKELRNKIHPSSRPDKSSRHGKTFEYSDEASNEKSSKRRDESRTFEEDDDYDFSDTTTTQSNEEFTSTEVSDEFVDSQINTNSEDSRELQNDERETPLKDKMPNSNPELSGEITSSTEKFELPKDAVTHDEKHSLPNDESISEGVLKFTDEIPSSEKIEELSQSEDSKTVPEISQDYIDDNYEPQSYKEHNESSPTTEAAITEKNIEKESSTLQTSDEKNTEEIPTATTDSTSTTEKEEITKIQNDQAQNPPEIDVKMEKSIEKPIEIEEITSSTSTTSTSTTTSTTTTTTTAKPTSPKLFKPFTLRKNYVYIPPTTTPVPVIIKQRLPLLNPKPAKPPKSYNELAPKPVIRKTPLFARKTTIRTTTIDNRETSTELPGGTTDSWMTEEIDSSGSTTSLPTTEVPPSSSQASDASPIPNDDEKPSHNEDHISSPTSDNFELLPKQEIPTFTPYPLLLKLSEATASMHEKLSHEEETTVTEDISTTERADMENNNVPSLSEPEMTTITTVEASTTSITEEVSTEKKLSSSSEASETTELPAIENTNPPSLLQENTKTNKPDLEIVYFTTIKATASEVVTENPEITMVLKEAITNNEPTVASIKAVARRPGAMKRTAFFNCLEKEMYRFYADGRDCRLFHYCSPGFTSRQVLDFRFVCEEGTAFDEESQSCLHDVKSSKCLKRVW